MACELASNFPIDSFIKKADLRRLLCHRDRNHQQGKKESKMFHYETFIKVLVL